MPLIIMHASLCRFELLPLIDLGSSDKPKPLSKVSCGIPLIFSCFLLHVKKKNKTADTQTTQQIFNYWEIQLFMFKILLVILLQHDKYNALQHFPSPFREAIIQEQKSKILFPEQIILFLTWLRTSLHRNQLPIVSQNFSPQQSS